MKDHKALFPFYQVWNNTPPQKSLQILPNTNSEYVTKEKKKKEKVSFKITQFAIMVDQLW